MLGVEAYAQQSLSPTDPEDMQVRIAPWYRHGKEGGPVRELNLHFTAKFKGKINISISHQTEQFQEYRQLDSLTDQVSVCLPKGVGLDGDTDIKLNVQIGKKHFYQSVHVPQQRQWTVYVYPHSHLDIGYTNVPEVVKALHVRNLDVGMDLAEKTAKNAVGERFIWNPEATWIVDHYLRQADSTRMSKFIEAVHAGRVKIDAAHSSIDLSTCSDEELYRVFENSRRIGALTGKPIRTMVQVDLPGAPWGLVQVAAQQGIRGVFYFPNYYDMRKHWENKPFYWVAPNGKDSVLFLQGISYGLGYRVKGSKYGLGRVQHFSDDYDRLSTADPSQDFLAPLVFDETRKLEQAGSPYDILPLTWSMADNCLIDADLPEAVKRWNEQYAYPKMVIAGTEDILNAYEIRYGDIIPSQRGDFTEFWTNGLGSDARSVGRGRRAKEDLVQTETLWSLMDDEHRVDSSAFDSVWENLLLAGEHTWGFQDPSAPLAKVVEENKAGYFENALLESNKLLDELENNYGQDKGHSFTIYNTLDWNRSGIVTIPAAKSVFGDRIVDEKGKTVSSQRLTTGELVFEAKDIPSQGGRKFSIRQGKARRSKAMYRGNHVLENSHLSIRIDSVTGNISSLYDKRMKRELVDAKSKFSLNSFNYLRGVLNGLDRDTLRPVTHARDVVVSLKEDGPVITSLLVSARADGTNWLTREIRLFKNFDHIELINRLDKAGGRQKEGIHFGFAFDVPNATVRMDVPMAVMVPERDQLPYANKNWFAFQRWVDVSNEQYGITWTGIETPLIELGDITGTILDGARQEPVWLKKVPQTSTLLSWPINNHWDTNFPLEQQGEMEFRYALHPHPQYDQASANRFGMEQHRPLLLLEGTYENTDKPLVQLDNPRVQISSLRKSNRSQVLNVRLRSISEKRETVVLKFPRYDTVRIEVLQPDGTYTRLKEARSELGPYESITLRIVPLRH